jgi:hypothetical protein
MDPDNLKQAWQAQSSPSRLTINAELLLREVQRNQRSFRTTIFWRDVREVGTGLLLTPIWIYLGIRLALPWTWFLSVPAILWIAGFMLVDRMRYKRQPPESGESLRDHVESSLAEVEHQIWLLRNVFWWYLLPIVLSCLAFFGQVAWLGRSDGWLTALAVGLVVLVAGMLVAGIYWLNQEAVRTDLEPRREELKALLGSLEGESPFAAT